MRITVLTGSVPSAIFIDAQINAMAAEGFNMTVIGKKEGTLNYEGNTHVIITPQNTMERLFFILKMLLATGFKYCPRIVANSKNIAELYHNLLFYLPIIYSRPDRIHIQWAAFVHNRDLLFELFPGKILVSLRGAHINYTPITTPEIGDSYLRLFPKVRRFHAVSEAIALAAEKYGARRANTDVVYSFVSDELIAREIRRKHVQEKLQIISVGRFFWKKGYEYAIDALGILHKQGVSFSYTIIAEGKTPPALIYQLHQLGIEDKVKIVNGLPHADVVREIEKHDVLLLPSVEEGIANVALEAMAVGTPVITTNVGGMREAVEHGISGYIVKARDIYGTARALEEFYQLNAEQRFAIATEAKNRLVKKHTRQIFAERFRQFYNR